MAYHGSFYTKKEGDIIEVIIRDEFGKKIARSICKIKDKKQLSKMGIWLSKYDIIIDNKDIKKELDEEEKDWFDDEGNKDYLNF